MEINPVVLQFVNGNTFFYGIVLFLFTSLMAFLPKRKIFSGLSRFLTFLGILAVLLSSTPLPIWFYVLWGSSIVCFLFYKAHSGLETNKQHAYHLPPIVVIIISLVAALWELPYHTKPSINTTRITRIIVIADSISAGIGDKTTTWPVILKKKYSIDIVDLSLPGATLESAITQAKGLIFGNSDRSLIILEIGGNDMLGETKIDKFQYGFDELLKVVSKSTNKVVLLELPLPPFHNHYGKIQRELTAKYHTVLIPKHYFTQVLGHPDATMDGLHLSETGHHAMVQMLEEFIAFPELGQRAK